MRVGAAWGEGESQHKGPTTVERLQGNGAGNEAGGLGEAVALQVEGSLAPVPGTVGKLENSTTWLPFITLAAPGRTDFTGRGQKWRS